MEVESTAIEQPANINDDISAIYDEMSAEDAEFEEVADPVAEPVEDPAIEPEVQTVKAPEHWAAADKEMFLSQTPEAQEWLLARHKSMEADYTRKSQEVGDIRRTAEAWQPVQEIFKQFPNLNPQQTVQEWAQVAKSLADNPLGTLNYLAKQYNVDLGNQPEQGFVDPEISALKQEINTLKSSLTRQETERNQTAQNTKISEIESFAGQKTEAGEPAHPYFEELLPTITQLAKATGEKDLKKLYDSAKWANPEIREKVLAEQKTAEKRESEKRAIAEAEKAKKAAKVKTGSSANTSPSSDLSIEEQLRQAWGS